MEEGESCADLSYGQEIKELGILEYGFNPSHEFVYQKNGKIYYTSYSVIRKRMRLIRSLTQFLYVMIRYIPHLMERKSLNMLYQVTEELGQNLIYRDCQKESILCLP
ncbi:hypothetical protein [Eshraghiella crossota]|uniref:hypothetical protein n=1 Tax=Eshraghiella crossota TaxID=45851 RepID=UPI003AB8D025